MNCELEDKVFEAGEQGFERLAMEVFHFQYRNNPVYRSFVHSIGKVEENIVHATQIPYLPVQLFKTQVIATGSFEPEAIFESSGTTSTGNSRHFVRSLLLYRKSFLTGFNLFYGAPDDWCIIGLLPSYLERQHSSLVVMVDELISRSKHPDSGFYLYETAKLADLLKANEQKMQKTLLIGVTFALLDLAEGFRYPLQHTVVMETGGMKGRRKELTRNEAHGLMKSAWDLDSIHSEYGMTELLSQAYSSGNGRFSCPPWMRIVLREEDDPLSLKKNTSSAETVKGIINVIDLANLHSCSFIATDDIGKLYSDGSFEVAGRMDSSDVRGCNLMYSD